MLNYKFNFSAHRRELLQFQLYEPVVTVKLCFVVASDTLAKIGSTSYGR